MSRKYCAQCKAGDHEVNEEAEYRVVGKIWINNEKMMPYRGYLCKDHLTAMLDDGAELRVVEELKTPEPVKIELGRWVETPRFLKVRIKAIFSSVELAEDCGFKEGTDFRDSDWHIRGKHVGENRMIFAAVRRNPIE